MNSDENSDMQLIDIIEAVFKWKWLVIGLTAAGVLLGGILSLLSPKKWDTSALIQPSRMLIQTSTGRFDEILLIHPQQLAGQVSQSAYNQRIAEVSGISLHAIPRIRASDIRNTDLVRVSIVQTDVAAARKVLNTLFDLVKSDLDQKAEIEITSIESDINSEKINITRLQKQIESNQKKHRIIQRRLGEIEKEMDEIRIRTRTLEKTRDETLGKETDAGTTLGKLLYANEIQNNLRYLNTLTELLNEKKLEDEELLMAVENGQQEIQQIETRIGVLEKRKGRIDLTQLVKPPTATSSPVSPRTRLNLLIGALLGFLVSAGWALFFEYIKSHRRDRATKA